MAKDNPFTQPRPRKQERPTLDDVSQSAAEALKMLGEVAAATTRHFAQLVVVLPDTQEIHDLRERAKAKVHDIADAL